MNQKAFFDLVLSAFLGGNELEKVEKGMSRILTSISALLYINKADPQNGVATNIPSKHPLVGWV